MATSPALRRPPALRLPQLRWPLPALLAWAAGWMAMIALSRTGLASGLAAVVVGLLVGAAPALVATTFWRRAIVAGGFPLSLLFSGLATVLPAWAWLLPLAVLALAYPVTAWRDAPVFPTPSGALAGLSAHFDLPPRASVLDAGCGLGHGLRALRAAWPDARIAGVEWSWPLTLATRMRCPWASVSRGDMWRASWSAHDLVYLFQRPESMARALAKADAEMRPGTWVVSLEFEATGRAAHAVMRLAHDRPVWIYRIGCGTQRDLRTGKPDQSRDGGRSTANSLLARAQGADNSGRYSRIAPESTERQ